LKKADDWLAQLELEPDTDTELLGRAQLAFRETLGMAKQLADPAWSETYMERLVAACAQRLADRKEAARRKVELRQWVEVADLLQEKNDRERKWAGFCLSCALSGEAPLTREEFDKREDATKLKTASVTVSTGNKKAYPCPSE
jgi:hypothetical protein